jgi:hypothetical protein
VEDDNEEDDELFVEVEDDGDEIGTFIFTGFNKGGVKEEEDDNDDGDDEEEEEDDDDDGDTDIVCVEDNGYEEGLGLLF